MFDCIWDDKKILSLHHHSPGPPSFLNPQPPSCLAVFITLLFPLNIIFISDCHGTGEMRLLIKFGSRNAQRSAWLKCPQCALNAEDERHGGAGDRLIQPVTGQDNSISKYWWSSSLYSSTVGHRGGNTCLNVPWPPQEVGYIEGELCECVYFTPMIFILGIAVLKEQFTQ